MNKPANYIPAQPVTPQGRESVDKVGLAMSHALLAPGVKELYQKGPITILEHGDHAFINFHAECLSPGQSLLRQIAFHLYELARFGVFVPEFASQIMGTLNLINFPHLYNESVVLDCLAAYFTVSQIELAFDFYGPVPWTIKDHGRFWHIGSTLYTKDYQQKTRTNRNGDTVKNGTQRSLVCIYDHAECHDYDGQVTRLELRHCGSYAEKWNFLKLDNPFAEILAECSNQLAGTLHKAMKPKDISFNMESIQETHPSLYPILQRWATWGKASA
jgi:hypothetical protein